MRLLAAVVIALAVLLVAPGTAPAPPPPIGFLPPAPASVAADGTAAVAFAGRDGELLVRVRRPGAGTTFDPAYAVPESSSARQFWVVAEPGGSARVLWVAARSDYNLIDPEPQEALMSAGADGVEQVSPLFAPSQTLYDVAANPQGDVVVAWADGTAGGAATAAAGEPFALVPGPVGANPQAAVAPGGAALIVSNACDQGTCLRARERPAGATFGEPTTIDPEHALQAIDVALASDGSALIAGRSRDRVSALQRPPGGPWRGPIDVGGAGAVETAVAAGIARGGSSVVAYSTYDAFPNADDGTRVREIAGDGAAGAETTLPVCCGDLQLAVRDADGAAAFASGGRVLARAPGGSFFSLLDEVDTAKHFVALGADGLLLTRTGSDDDAYSAVLGGTRVALGDVPTSGPEERRFATVANRPVLVRGNRARVPVYCPGFQGCSGSLRAGGETREFALVSGEGQIIAVPAGPAGSRLNMILDARHGPTLRLSRRVTRRPPACRIAPFAPTLARGEGSRIAIENPSGEAPAVVVACTRRIDRRVLPGAEVAEQAAVNKRFAAYLLGEYGRRKLRLADLVGRTVRTYPLYGRSGPAVVRVLVSAHGAVVLADRSDARVRIRALDAAGDRLLDFAPGIDPESLRVEGDTAMWRRDGIPQQATLRAGR